jgi:hypothetical protein
MSSDISRQRFDPVNDFSSVLMQQGRVQLDADWNEWNEILDRRWRAETVDIIGRATVPKETPHGFEIGIDANNNLTVGLGRIYVDGLLAENHGEPPLVFDPVLAEVRGSDPDKEPPDPNAQPVLYHKQPYFPKVDTNAELPQELQSPDLAGGPYLVYIDVWEREVTSVENPGLIEKAVGVDTTSRLQTAWQVRVLTKDIGQDVTCDTPIQAWDDWIAPSAGRLTIEAVGVATPEDPCQIPPTGGYRGLDNRTYRVEIHDPGAVGEATFKWSRDNASVATNISRIENSTILTVDRTAWDSKRRFSEGDWVEITDDWREFSLVPGDIRRIAKPVDDAARTITLDVPLTGPFPVDGENLTTPERHTRIKRWDQRGLVRDSNGATFINLDDANNPSPGLIHVPPAGTSLILENGIEVTFTTEPDGGSFRSGDYWISAARTADATIDEFEAAPPRGVHHHYCKLAIIEDGQKTGDCRTKWPPDSGEACCDCSVCVTADSHNTGTLTLQSAVNQVTAVGGKICLGPGIYLITSPVTIARGSNIEISGHGLPQLVASGLTSEEPIFQIEYCVDINIEDIAFAGSVVGVAISNSWFTRITRCLFTADAGSSPMSLGVGFSGFVWNAKVHDCFFNNVQVGIGSVTAEAAGEAFIARVSIQNNDMVCTAAGFRFDDPKLPPLFLELLFADNLVLGPIGFQLGGQGLDISIERNSFALTARAGTAVNAAIVCAGNQVRISNNQIFSLDPGHRGTDGIVLGVGFMYGAQVTGNRVDGLAEHGILIKKGTFLWETVISKNQLLRLGGAGMIMEPGEDISAFDLNITSNAMTLVGMTPGVDKAFENPTMAGILLLAPMINVNVDGNAMEAVGTDPGSTAVRNGMGIFVVIDFRAAGNRIIDVGPPSTVGLSAGIVVLAAIGRVDIADNEVRRAGMAPPGGDPSNSGWSAVAVGVAVGNVAIRGNMLESFGSTPTVVLASALSCVFTDNQCFLDNVIQQGPTSPNVLAVLLGFNEKSNAGAIMASNNFVQTPVHPEGVYPPAITLNPPTGTHPTVLGNITRGGSIFIGSNQLEDPWLSLNVRTL